MATILGYSMRWYKTLIKLIISEVKIVVKG